MRVSMEEQRQRQEDEQRRALAASNTEGTAQESTGAETESTPAAVDTADPNSEEAMLQRALALSTETPTEDALPDFANMTEEEQIAFAMQMSMQDARKFMFFLPFLKKNILSTV